MKLPRSLSACSSSLREGSIIGLMLIALIALASTYESATVSILDRAVTKTACIVSFCRSYLVEQSKIARSAMLDRRCVAGEEEGGGGLWTFQPARPVVDFVHRRVGGLRPLV